MTTIATFWEKHNKSVFLFLAFVFGIILLIPIADYQPILSQGDHGHDLYSFNKVLDGQRPYKDFWWVYGPLMPYYYSVFYDFFGINIQSILIGKAILIFFAGLMVYATLALMIRPSFAFLGTAWYFIFSRDFFFTYNHIGGIAMISFITYFLFRYIKQQNYPSLYCALVGIFVLSLIKVNFGAAALFCFVVTVFATDFTFKNQLTSRKKTIYGLALLGIPLLVTLIYWLLLRGLPLYEIRQCLPYLSTDHPHNVSIWISLELLLKTIFNNIINGTQNATFSAVVILSIVQVISLLLQKKTDQRFKQQVILTVGVLGLYYVLNLHEFLASGIYYRTYWSKPLSIMMMFLVVAYATHNFRFLIRFCFQSALVLVICLQISTGIFHMHLIRRSPHFLDLERGQIYSGNHPYWVQTVEDVTLYLKKHVKDDETFFAVPYDPLYYFLAGKTSPTRQLIFFEHINIPEEQEKTIIAELEENKANWVVLSSRFKSPDKGLGVFGETYCPLLGSYVFDNFKPVAMFGDWGNPAGWAWGHGIQIMKRK